MCIQLASVWQAGALMHYGTVPTIHYRVWHIRTCAHTVLFVKVEIYLAELCVSWTEMEADDELLAENKLTMGS